jgi:hypothetical protein
MPVPAMAKNGFTVTLSHREHRFLIIRNGKKKRE